MKAKRWLGLLIALFVAVMVGAFVACDPADNGDDGPGEKGENQITVTWYDGRNVLKTENIDKGSKPEKWTPEKSGFTFVDWYQDASCAVKYDFTKACNEDTDIYAKWRDNNAAKDDRLWYAIGTLTDWTFLTEKDGDEWYVKEDLANLDPNDFIFTNDNGVYKLQLRLRYGMKFRFATNLLDTSTWEGDEGRAEAGLGNLKGFSYAAGINPEKGQEVTEEDRQYGQVKDENGTVVFEGGFEYNMPTCTWNIWPAEGSDGVYEFTLNPYTGGTDDTLHEVDWKLVEKLDPLDETHDMYIVGTVTGDHENWADDYDTAIKLTRDTNNRKLWKTFVTVEKSMYPSWSATQNPAGVPAAAIKVKNNVEGGKDYGENGGANNIYLTEGTYCITYEEDSNIVKYEKCDYYVIGTFVQGSTNVNFVVQDGVTPKMTSTDGTTYTAENVMINDVSKLDGYTWLPEQGGADAIFALKVAYGCSLGVKEDYGTNGGNVYLTQAGAYKITFNATTKAVTTELTAAAKDIKITYYEIEDDAPKQLHEQDAKSGDWASWKPDGKSGYIFDGWYTNEECTQKYDNTPLLDDTSLYGKWVESSSVVDSRDWYVVGVLDGESWNTPDSKYAMKRGAQDSEGLTLYTLELDMFNGYNFKIATKKSDGSTNWDGTEVGYSKFKKGGDTADAYDKFEHGTEEKQETENVLLKAGNNGTYLITLHVDPANTKTWFEIKFVKEIATGTLCTLDYYITGNGAGDLKNSGAFNARMPAFKLEKSSTMKGSYTVYTFAKLTLYKGDNFKIISTNTPDNNWDGTELSINNVKGGKENFEAADGDNIGAKKPGEYKLTLYINGTSPKTDKYVDIELTKELTTTEKDMGYYLTGTISNWTAGKTNYPCTNAGGNKWEYKGLRISGSASIKAIHVQETIKPDGTSAYSVIGAWIGNKDSTDKDKNLMLSSGTWDISFDATDTGSLKATQAS